MVGTIFGKWKVVKEVRIPNQKDKRFLCICVCGKEKIVLGTSHKLRTNQCRECNTVKHGMHSTSTYRIWESMKARCSNPTKWAYKYYGGRGITVCDRWQKFENFFEDMGQRPDNLQLDRIDNDKGYSPDNCKWVTVKENNASNKKILLPDEMIGHTFGQWTILERVIFDKAPRWRYKCKCVCGFIFILPRKVLTGGRSTKCVNCRNSENGKKRWI